MRVLLFQLDGRVPNIALMRVAHHHRVLGDSVELRWTGNPERQLWDNPDRVYASLLFERTRPVADKMRDDWGDVIFGGTGHSVAGSLEDIGITTVRQDYSIHPGFRQSIGFTQRGCRLRCSFCVVPKKEGAMRGEQSILELWRGEPWPRELILLDNDFFGQPDWRDRVAEIREGRFKVSFNQGINARFLTDEAAAAIAGLDYRDDSMRFRRIYTAWDNLRDEKALFAGLGLLKKHGVRPGNIMVYTLFGYWPGETTEDRLHRIRKLREFGAVPYPMPFIRTRELVGMQRWVVGAYDKRISWEAWSAAKFRPENICN